MVRRTIHSCLGASGLLLALCADAATLSGTVTTTNGLPLSNMPIRFDRVSPFSGNVVPYPQAATTTDITGAYTTINLDSNAYWLGVANTLTGTNGALIPTGYEALYYHPSGNQPIRDRQAPIVVDDTTPNLTGFDFFLEEAYAVTGHVFAAGAPDFTLVDFDVFDANTGDFLPFIDAKARPDGTYIIYGFPVGDYLLRCDPAESLGFYSVFQGDVFLDSAATPLQITGPGATLDFHLSPGYSISGVIGDGATGLAGIDIDYFLVTSSGIEFIPDNVASAISPLGFYQTSLLRPGDYILRADPTPTSMYSLIYYTATGTNATLREHADVRTITSSSLTNLDIVLPPGGLISGSIRTTNNQPVAGMDIDVFDSTGARMEVDANSDTNGFYTIGAVLPGNYSVRVDPTNTQFFPRTYYSNGLFKREAILITVLANTTTSNIDFSVLAGGYITGSFHDTNGSDAIGIDVDVLDAAGQLMEVNARSNTQGDYSIGPLPSGSYRIRADPEPLQFLARTYYPSTADAELATLVTVTQSSTTFPINIELPAAGAIAGNLTDQSLSPLPDIDLDVFEAISGNRADVDGASLPNGDYLIGPIPAGNFHLRADSSTSQVHLRTYYSYAIFSENALSIPVLNGQITSNINLSLEPGGFIEGTITADVATPAPDIDLDVFDGSRRLMEITARTDMSGIYRIGPLPPGPYTIRADPSPTQFFARTYYSNTLLHPFAQPVTVTVSSATQGIDFLLASAGLIEGHIFDESSNPLDGIDIDAFEFGTGNRVDVDGTSSTNGSYVLGPMPSGAYVVRADPDSTQFFARQYWNEAVAMSAASAIQVFAGHTQSNINFSLAPGSSLSGTIVDLSGNPLNNIDLDVFPAGGGSPALDQTTLSDSNGHYTIGPLPFGIWALRANPTAAQGYETRYFVSSGHITNAQPIELSTSNPIIDLNFSLGVNNPPQVVLSPFTGTQPDNNLQLDASLSLDSNSDRLLYAWKQISGPSVLFSDVTAPNPTITLPPGTTNHSLFQFEVTVYDFVTNAPPQTISLAMGNPLILQAHRSNTTMEIHWSLGSSPQPYKLQTSDFQSGWSTISTSSALKAAVPLPEGAAAFRISAEE